MIGTLLTVALEAYQEARTAAYDAARARVRRYMLEHVRCPYCNGSGRLGRTETPCGACNGTGLRQDNHPPEL